MKKILKWMLIVTSSIIALIFIGIMFIFGIIAPTLNQGSEPDFMGYETDMPLAGSLVTKTNIIRGSSYSKSSGPKYEQEYDSGVVLTQFKNSELTTPVLCDLPKGQNSTTYECQSGDIDGGGAYSVTVAKDKGELLYVDVYARIEGTRMYMSVPGKAQAELAEYTEWQNYFNSMKPVDLNDK